MSSVPSVLEPSFRESLVKEGRRSLAAHREAARGSGFPPPKASRPTFFHGFLLPFSLVVATLRHPSLGRTYLKLICVRALVVGIAAAVVFHASDGPEKGRHGIWVTEEAEPRPVHVHAPGLQIDVDREKGEKNIKILGTDIPVHVQKKGPPKLGWQFKSPTADDDDSADDPNEATDALDGPPPSTFARIRDYVSTKWTWLLWFIGIFSTVEAVSVFFSRRYDNWISFHTSLLARTRPEEAAPTVPKIGFEPRWAMKKLKRRVRGYVVFGAGIPLFALLRLIPSVGVPLFTIGLTIWSWYWLAIFTTAKSAHAWEDEATAPSPYLIRSLRDRPPPIRPLKPLHWYTSLWARLTRSMNAPAMTFERTPGPFLGLALARVILSLPGLYLVARPIIPVAAGRLCAETDPRDRFSLDRA